MLSKFSKITNANIFLQLAFSSTYNINGMQHADWNIKSKPTPNVKLIIAACVLVTEVAMFT